MFVNCIKFEKILREIKARVKIKRFPNQECLNHLLMSSHQIQLRVFRIRALGTLFHEMNNDLMVI